MTVDEDTIKWRATIEAKVASLADGQAGIARSQAEMRAEVNVIARAQEDAHSKIQTMAGEFVLVKQNFGEIYKALMGNPLDAKPSMIEEHRTNTIIIKKLQPFLMAGSVILPILVFAAPFIHDLIKAAK